MIFDKISEKGAQYLEGSYVRVLSHTKDVEDGLYYCSAGGGRGSVALYNAKDLGNLKTTALVSDKNSSLVEFLSPVLGYAYHKELLSAPYLKRISARSWRVGLTRRNLSYPGILEHAGSTVLEVLETIRDRDYPSFQEARDAARKYPIPFHRKYAVLGNDLYYRGERFGGIINDEIHLSCPDASYHSTNIESMTFMPCVNQEPKVFLYGKEDI